MALLVTVSFALTRLIAPAPAPKHEGKTLKQWLRDYREAQIDKQRITRVAWEFGTNAVPLLVRELEVRDSRLKKLIMGVASRLKLVRASTMNAEVRRAEAARLLGALGPGAKGALAGLTNAFDDPSSFVAYNAVQALVDIGPQTFPILTNALIHPSVPVRFAAFDCVMRPAFDLYDRSSVVLLCLRTPSLGLRVNGFRYVHLLENPTNAVELLAGCLDDSDPFVRQGAADAIGKLGARAILATPALLRVAQDPFPNVRLAVVGALARTQPERFTGLIDSVIPEVIGVMTNPRANVEDRRSAAGWLRQHDRAAKGAASVPLLMDALLSSDKSKLLRMHIETLYTTNASAEVRLPGLTGLLSYGDDEKVRVAAAEALAALGPDASPAVSALVECLDDISPYMRSAAARALASIGGTATNALPKLREKLTGDNAIVGIDAAVALYRLGVPASEVVPGLIDRLNHQFAKVRRTAAEALGSLGSDAKDAIRVLEATAQNDTDASVRDKAAAALKRIGSPVVAQ